MSYQRLPDSKRNEIIANFNEGKIDPDYEVIPNKNQKGKYTVRRRKVSLPTNEDVPNDDDNEPIMDEPENVQPEIPVFQNDSSYLPSYKMNKNAMFREMQMEMNKMFIEQMKMMRQQIKNQDRKRLKLKNKSQMVYDILSSVARDSEKEQPTPEPAPEPEVNHDEEEEHEETSSPDYFDNSYKNTQPVKPPEPEVHVPQPEPKVYQQPYEQDIDQIDGTYYKPISRRDRLNFKNFNI